MLAKLHKSVVFHYRFDRMLPKNSDRNQNEQRGPIQIFSNKSGWWQRQVAGGEGFFFWFEIIWKRPSTTSFDIYQGLFWDTLYLAKFNWQRLYISISQKGHLSLAGSLTLLDPKVSQLQSITGVHTTALLWKSNPFKSERCNVCTRFPRFATCHGDV